ncbi:MAG: polysaccharide deacetylase family protein [Lachnospiraceae bacterium]|nr:polysaccharide deacetylase family protein [Lachnospiraceae bacterium]
MTELFQNEDGKKPDWKGVVTLVFFLSAMFLLGRTVHFTVDNVSNSTHIISEADNWGLGGFGENGEKPTGNVSAEELKKYDAYYLKEGDEKVIYMTFDAGYENGNTEPILDALKKHNVSATFFVVGHYLESSPELVKRMLAEGHTVGNHTYTHPDMSAISNMEAFQKEMEDVEKEYEEITGKKMVKYYRPPQGKYSMENLKMAQELGYKTFFWSLAYVDWYQDKQPTKDEAFDKLIGRIHPGSIVLLHSTSSTNAEVLDELLGKWEEMGYRFGTLSELVGDEET